MSGRAAQPVRRPGDRRADRRALPAPSRRPHVRGRRAPPTGDGERNFPGPRPRLLVLAVSAVATRPPPRAGTVVECRAGRGVTPAATVKDLLAGVHVRLAKTDAVSVPLERYPTEGLVVRVTRIRAEVDWPARCIATGGLAPLIATETKTIAATDDLLTLKGLKLLYHRNQT